MSATTLLRPGLLEGLSLLIAGAAGPPTPLGSALAQAFSELGAQVRSCTPNGEDEAAIDQTVIATLADIGAIEMLVVDGAGLFDQGAPTALRACLDAAWNVTRAVVNHAFLAARLDERGGRVEQSGRDKGVQCGGRIVYLTPAPHAGEHALAARAGLENLARTLSIEWARHHINLIAIGGRGSGSRWSDTSAEELAALVAYLASPAGAYFSGCLLDLSGSAPAPR